MPDMTSIKDQLKRRADDFERDLGTLKKQNMTQPRAIQRQKLEAFYRANNAKLTPGELDKRLDQLFGKKELF